MTAGPPDAEESRRRGKALRKELPRRQLADWRPAADRPDPLGILQAQGESRDAELLPIRYGRMSESAFAFYRGAAAIMAADICRGPSTGIQVQLCGDAHLSNFGIYASPSRSLVFDCNDFDETFPGPWEWDLKRLVASLAIAGRQVGFDAGERSGIVQAAVRSYRDTVREFATESSLTVWYAHINADQALHEIESRDKKSAKLAATISKKAHRKDSLRAFDKMTTTDSGEPRFTSQPPLLVPADEMMGDATHEEILDGLQETLAQYRHTLAPDRQTLLDSYRVVDAARRVVGVGSVGTHAWIALLLGPTSQDPLILQFKEATNSVLEPYSPADPVDHQGRRVVEGQRLMQAQSDILLGWERMHGPWGGARDFYVRQLWDGKYSAEVETMSVSQLEEYGGYCAWTLARAHSRSGDRFEIAGYVGGSTVLDEALAEFAERYADQNEVDFAALRSAIDSGAIEARAGV